MIPLKGGRGRGKRSDAATIVHELGPPSGEGVTCWIKPISRLSMGGGIQGLIATHTVMGYGRPAARGRGSLQLRPTAAMAGLQLGGGAHCNSGLHAAAMAGLQLARSSLQLTQ